LTAIEVALSLARRVQLVPPKTEKNTLAELAERVFLIFGLPFASPLGQAAFIRGLGYFDRILGLKQLLGFRQRL